MGIVKKENEKTFVWIEPEKLLDATFVVRSGPQLIRFASVVALLTKEVAKPAIGEEAIDANAAIVEFDQEKGMFKITYQTIEPIMEVE